MAFHLLEALGDSERTAVMSRLRQRRHLSGEVLFNEADIGNCMYFLKSGRLTVETSTPAGATVTIRVVHPGEFIGELALVVDSHRRTGRAVALEPSETMVLNRREFDELRHDHPAIDRLLVVALADHVARTTELVNELMMPPDERVWRRLAAFADAYGDEPVRMTQEELARATGTVRQTVNRALRRAEQAGFVERTRGAIRVRDREGLARLAEGRIEP